MSKPRKRKSAKITPYLPEIFAPIANKPPLSSVATQLSASLVTENPTVSQTPPPEPIIAIKTEVDAVQTWEQRLGELALAYHSLWLGLIVVLAAGLRLFNLGLRSVWYDESFSLVLANRDPGTILTATAHDYHPPLWYLLLWLWEKLFGLDLIAARCLSVGWGVATVALLYLLAQKLFGSRTALLAALLAALAPFEILYSQEVRMYSFDGFLGVLLVYVFYRAYRFDTRLDWCWFGLVATLALYTLYFSVFGLVALDIFFVGAVWFSRTQKKWPRTKIWHWLVANLIIAVLYLPWLIAMLGQVARVQKAYWIQRPNPLEFLRLFDIYLFNTTNLTVPLWLATLGLILSAIVFVILFNSLRFKLRRSEKGRYRRSFELSLMLAYWLLPVLIVFVVSYLFGPIYLERSLIAFAAPVYILLARVVQVAHRPRRWLFLLVPGCLIIVAALGYYYSSRFYSQHYELEPAATYLEARYQPGDIVIHSNKLSYLPFVYLKVPGAQFLIPEQPDSPHNDLSVQTAQAITLSYTPIAEILAKVRPNQRVWVVVTDPQPDTDPQWWAKTGQSWLEQQHYKLLSQTPDTMFWGETVLLYAPG